MGQTHKAPGGQALGQGELQGDDAVLVRRHLGIEEGGLVQVLTHLRLLLGCVLAALVGI